MKKRINRYKFIAEDLTYGNIASLLQNCIANMGTSLFFLYNPTDTQ